MPTSKDSSKLPSSENGKPVSRTSSAAHGLPPTSAWLALPAPLKHIFSLFPLRILPCSPLPIRTAHDRDRNTLYVFTDSASSEHNAPSFNPTCLKWQTYLKFLDLDFRTVASTNHASPTGALPFLMPGMLSGSQGEAAGQVSVVPSNRLQQWARDKGLGREEPDSMRYDAYISLLDHRIRRAWLYTLYLKPKHLNSVAAPLYINPSTRSTPVRLALSNTLKTAALAELLTTSSTVSPDVLMAEADRAFAALSTLLGDDNWFFGMEEPGLFDASVFAYTYLLLDGMVWEESILEEKLRKYGNLIEHKDRISRRFYMSNTKVQTSQKKNWRG